MRFVNPAVEEHEKQDGFTRYYAVLTKPGVTGIFAEIAYLPEGDTKLEIVREIGERGLDWISLHQIDAKPQMID